MGNVLNIFNTPGASAALIQQNSICIEIYQSPCTPCCGGPISKDWTKTTSFHGGAENTLLGWGFSEQEYLKIRAKVTTRANCVMVAGYLCAVLGAVVQLYNGVFGNRSRRLMNDDYCEHGCEDSGTDFSGINFLDIVSVLLFIASALILMFGFKIQIVSAFRLGLAKKGEHFEVFWSQGFKGESSDTPTLIVIVNKQQALATAVGTIIQSSTCTVIPTSDLEAGLASPEV
jgi:hypothetical protein